jgi:hypothetical protein
MIGMRISMRSEKKCYDHKLLILTIYIIIFMHHTNNYRRGSVLKLTTPTAISLAPPFHGIKGNMHLEKVCKNVTP